MQTKPMTPFMTDVLCVGQAPYDLSFTVPQHPEPDEKTVATHFTANGGGPAANAAFMVARLGGHSALAAYLGQDVYGNQHLHELEAVGIDTHFIVRGKAPTAISVVLVKPNGQRALVNYRANTPPLTRNSLDFSLCQPCVILFDGLEPVISPPLARQARQQGIPTVLDAGSVHAGTTALIGRVDYAVISAKFSSQFTGRTNPEAALQLLAQHIQTVVITLGEEGIIWRRSSEEGHLPAFPVTAVDTTGAGDAFHGAFAYGLAQNMPWPILLRYASAAAALTCTRYGARAALPTRQMVEKFLQQNATN